MKSILLLFLSMGIVIGAPDRFVRQNGGNSFSMVTYITDAAEASLDENLVNRTTEIVKEIGSFLKVKHVENQTEGITTGLCDSEDQQSFNRTYEDSQFYLIIDASKNCTHNLMASHKICAKGKISRRPIRGVIMLCENGGFSANIDDDDFKELVYKNLLHMLGLHQMVLPDAPSFLNNTKDIELKPNETFKVSQDLIKERQDGLFEVVVPSVIDRFKEQTGCNDTKCGLILQPYPLIKEAHGDIPEGMSYLHWSDVFQRDMLSWSSSLYEVRKVDILTLKFFASLGWYDVDESNAARLSEDLECNIDETVKDMISQLQTFSQPSQKTLSSTVNIVDVEISDDDAAQGDNQAEEDGSSKSSGLSAGWIAAIIILVIVIIAIVAGIVAVVVVFYSKKKPVSDKTVSQRSKKAPKAPDASGSNKEDPLSSVSSSRPSNDPLASEASGRPVDGPAAKKPPAKK